MRSLRRLAPIAALGVLLVAPAALGEPAEDVARLQQEGNAAFLAGRFAEARERFAAALERDPGWASHCMVLGVTEHRLAHYAEAERLFVAAATSPALRAQALLDAGIAADSDGRPAAALGHYRAASAAGSPEVSSRAAPLIAAAEQELRDEQRNAALRLGKQGRDDLRAGRTVDAIVALRGALDRGREAGLARADLADLEATLGQALRRLGREDEALAALRRAVDLSPDEADLRLALGLTLRDAGRVPEGDAELQRATSGKLSPEDRALALSILTPPPVEKPPPRLTAELQASIGYDSNYAATRELLFAKALHAERSVGAPALEFGVDPRLRLFGRPGNGLFIDGLLAGTLYLTREADPFSLATLQAALEGEWSPLPYLSLALQVRGFADASGLLGFGLFQMGGVLAGRAVLWEGSRWATRLRYAHTFIDAPDAAYHFLSGHRDQAQLSQILYVADWRLSLGYHLRFENVGTQTVGASAILAPATASELGCRARLGRACLADEASTLDDVTYEIPFSYVGHSAVLQFDGPLGWGIVLEGGLRYQHRTYLEPVRLDPDPGQLYHRDRVDHRVSAELALRRHLLWGVQAQVSVYLLVSLSTIENGDARFRFDYDDRNFTRVMATLDLMRRF